MKKLKSIDLFAGIGGTRLAFEKACKKLNIEPETVFYSEINNSCREVYNKNFKTKAWADIKLIPNKLINKNTSPIFYWLDFPVNHSHKLVL